jgi:phosphoribosylaminoimidazole-succinocarboxamide synthase
MDRQIDEQMNRRNMSLTTDIKPSAQGKVRDLYDLGDLLLFVASDRISAFDYVLQSQIPYKGEVLTQMSLFWFNLLNKVTQNHLVSTEVEDLPEPFNKYATELAGRFMLVHKAQMFNAECIVRGYLAGSGLKEYQKQGTVCGIQLPAGLVNSSKLDKAIYTPSTKADIGDHDQNISFEQSVEILGRESAELLRQKSLEIYETARDYAATRGIIIADTKFEFGRMADQIVLADEVLTPDSSRFWPADSYQPGQTQPSFDKQFVRDWLSENWDKSALPDSPPALPDDIIRKTSEKYIQAYELLTGQPFVPKADLL